MSEVRGDKVLVVDDTETNIDILMDSLSDDYELSVAMEGMSALEAVEEEPPDIILLDIMMPGMNGYEVCERLKENPECRDIPIIFLTAVTDVESKAKGFEMGAVDYITKPFEVMEVKARVKTHLVLKRAKKFLEEQNEILERKVRERTKELEQTQEVTILSFAAMAETRDPETGEHIKRTQHYVRTLAEYLKDNPSFSSLLEGNTIELLYKSAPLHDIGKVGVSDNILLKPGRLTTEEFEEMKKHTIIGRDVILKAERQLDNSYFLKFAEEIAYNHHEKWDGTGYPRGLAGTDIPLSGRLMALADVYDALISKRVYKPPFSHERARNIILEGKRKHFDPDIVDAFLVLEDKFIEIARKYQDRGD